MERCSALHSFLWHLMATNDIRSLFAHLMAFNDKTLYDLSFSSRQTAIVIQGIYARMPFNVIFVCRAIIFPFFINLSIYHFYPPLLKMIKMIKMIKTTATKSPYSRYEAGPNEWPCSPSPAPSCRIILNRSAVYLTAPDARCR